MRQAHAVILAGGEGQRLGGVRKADLRIGGIRLLDRVVAALGPMSTPLLVAVGPEERGWQMSGEFTAIEDLPGPCGGPLAGLAAAVAVLAEHGVTTGKLISVAVDTPFLPDDFAQRMLAELADAPVAYAAWNDEFYPPNAAWELSALVGLPAAIAGAKPPASLKALQRAMGARRVDWAGQFAENPFVNVNTPADLIALGRRARD